MFPQTGFAKCLAHTCATARSFHQTHTPSSIIALGAVGGLKPLLQGIRGTNIQGQTPFRLPGAWLWCPRRLAWLFPRALLQIVRLEGFKIPVPPLSQFKDMPTAAPERLSALLLGWNNRGGKVEGEELPVRNCSVAVEKTRNNILSSLFRTIAFEGLPLSYRPKQW